MGKNERRKTVISNLSWVPHVLIFINFTFFFGFEILIYSEAVEGERHDLASPRNHYNLERFRLGSPHKSLSSGRRVQRTPLPHQASLVVPRTPLADKGVP